MELGIHTAVHIIYSYKEAPAGEVQATMQNHTAVQIIYIYYDEKGSGSWFYSTVGMIRISGG